jgi:hypothetical protein
MKGRGHIPEDIRAPIFAARLGTAAFPVSRPVGAIAVVSAEATS